MTKTENIPLLFLDFDGVLNSYAEGSYLTNDNETYGPSKTICNKLKRLCERTGAKIILSSNWRKFDVEGWWIHDGQRFQNPIMKLYPLIGEHVIGILPPIRHITKAEALIIWMEENDFDVENRKWVVLDDDPRENFASTSDYGIKGHYIETDSEFGITDEIIKDIENRFTGIIKTSKRNKEDES